MEGNSGGDMQRDEIKRLHRRLLPPNHKINIVRPLPDYTESMYRIQVKTERVYNMRSS